MAQDAAVRAALTANRRGLDLTDGVIAELGRAAGCYRTVTFDERADDSMQLLGPRGSPSHGDAPTAGGLVSV